MAEEGVYDDVTCVELSELDGGERVEMMVDIYMSADAVRAQETSTQRETPTQQTDVRTGSRSCRLAVVFVGLLCALLTTNVVQYLYYIRGQTSTVNCTAERETLLSSIRNLTEERDQLKSSYQNLTGEYKILQTRYDRLLNLTKWRKNENSFYFFSTEQKTWNQSRQDCRERGADLVIINSIEEQMFLIDPKKEKNFWIGLTDEEREGVWKWVDGQPLMEKEQFWTKDEPNDYHGKEDCAVSTPTVEDGQRTWNDISCSSKENWVCEFNLINSNLNTLTQHQ